jgi:hypothetical protein
LRPPSPSSQTATLAVRFSLRPLVAKALAAKRRCEKFSLETFTVASSAFTNESIFSVIAFASFSVSNIAISYKKS